MSPEELRALQPGDRVWHKSRGRATVIDASYGDRVTAVITIGRANLDEWEPGGAPPKVEEAPAPRASAPWSFRCAIGRHDWEIKGGIYPLFIDAVCSRCGKEECMR